MKRSLLIFKVVLVLLMASSCRSRQLGWKNRAFVIETDRIKSDLVPIKDKEFEMGIDLRDPYMTSYGKVRLGYGFWIAKNEVSLAEFKAFQAATDYRLVAEDSGIAYKWDFDREVKVELDTLSRKDNKLPVTCVTWVEAVAYCNWLNGKIKDKLPAGYELRLPTEAEWERSCIRGFSDKIKDEICWSRSNSKGRVRPIGTRKPDRRGIYDMLGNAAEWCQDWVAEYGESFVPVGPAKGEFKITRGGSVLKEGVACNSFFRGGGDPNKPYVDVGFRVAIGPKLETLASQRRHILSKNLHDNENSKNAE